MAVQQLVQEPTGVTEAPPAAQRLAPGAIGVRELVFFVVAAAAPLTVMAGVAPLTIQFGGIGGPGGYLVGGIVMVLFAVGFTAMARHVPNAGAFYAYIAQGLGRPAGVGSAYVAVFAYNAIAIGLLGAFASFAATTFDDLFGVAIAWQVWAALGLAAIAFLGYHRITLSARVLAVLLVTEVAILLVLALPVVFSGGEEGLSFGMFEPGNIFSDNVGAVFVIAFGAFLGFESTAIYKEEARDPGRTVRRATYIAVGFLAVFYTFIGWMILMAFGPERAVGVAEEDPTGMFFTAMDRWVGSGASDVMSVLIVTSAFAATLAFHNAASRYMFALGREGVLPRRLGRADAGSGAPRAASVAQVVLMLVVVAVFALFGADPYLNVLLWTNGPGILGVLLLQAICSAAVVAFFWRRRAQASPVERIVAPALSAASLLAVCVLVVNNFELLTAAGTALNAALIAPLLLCFAAGVAVAVRMRRDDPAAYQRLTTVRVDGPQA